MSDGGSSSGCEHGGIGRLQHDLCPECLLELALSGPSFPDVPGFEILGELGRGGTSIVYRAQQLHPRRLVALKMLRDGEFATPEAIADFRVEVETQSGLEHEDIVRVYAGLQSSEPYFFVMELVEAGNLADPVNRRHFQEQRAAARLMSRIARAVQCAHDRGVLHLDLKPSNILLRDGRHPVLADFGTARSLHEQLEESRHLWVTPLYMAPEHAARKRRDLLVGSDVYSLGAILYELLGGRPPHTDDRLPALVRKILEDPPPPLTELNPDVDRDLEFVCLTALAKEPGKRHASVAAFAEDLERFLTGHPPRTRRLSRPARLLRWARRQPFAAVSSALLALLLSFTLVTAVLVARQQAGELTQAALIVNENLARAEAVGMLHRLGRYAATVQKLAESSEGIRLASLETHETAGAALAKLSGDLTSSAIADSDGTPHARWPFVPSVYFSLPFEHRDFFLGARQLGLRGERGVYAARAYRSWADGVYKFALSAPIFDGQRWVGVVLGSIATDSTLPGTGRVRADGRTIVLLGLRDYDGVVGGPKVPVPRDFALLVHPRLSRGSEVLFPDSPELYARFGQAVPVERQFELNPDAPLLREHYRDPLLDGEWLAAFAPVGRTGFVVLVQSRAEAATEPATLLIGRFALGFVLAGALPLSLLALFAWHSRRKARAA